MALGNVSTDASGEPSGRPVVVLASGEVDLALAPELDRQIAGALEQNRGVIVDLSGATFLDSVALGVLINAQRESQSAGTELYLIIADERVARVFELTGLQSAFSIFDSRAALTDHLAGPAPQ